MSNLKKIDDLDYLLSFFRSLCRRKDIPVLILSNDVCINSRLTIENRKSKYLKIELLDKDLKKELNKNVEINLFHREQFFVFFTDIVNVNKNGVITIKKPSEIFLSLRRFVTRYRFQDNEHAYVIFKNIKKKFELFDINTKGFCFISDGNFFKKGTLVKNLTIRLPNKEEVWIDAKVVNIRSRDDKFLYGLYFSQMSWPAFSFLFSFIIRQVYPRLGSLADFSKSKIRDLFTASGYIIHNDTIKSKDAVKREFNDLVGSLDKTRDKWSVSANIVYNKDDRILSSLSSLRLYNNTFLGHQLAAVPEGRLSVQSLPQLYFGVTDYMLSQPSFSYELSYIIDLKWHDVLFKEVGERIADREKFIFDSLIYFKCNVDEFVKKKNRRNKYQVEMLYDPAEFIKFCSKHLEPLEKASYEYNIKDFDLKEIKELYNKLGLYLDRCLWGIKKNNKVVGYAVAEVYTNGLNFVNIVDMCRVYLTVEEIAANVLNDLLESIVDFFREHKKNEFYLFIKISEGVLQNDISCLEYKGKYGRVMMNREGMHEYNNLIKLKYYK